MSSGKSAVPIINLNGSIPSASQGAAADMPVNGSLIGQWYLATDTQVLYQWTGSGWNIVLQSGAGSTPSLNQVLAAGNTIGGVGEPTSINFEDANGNNVGSLQTAYGGPPSQTTLTFLDNDSGYGIQVAANPAPDVPRITWFNLITAIQTELICTAPGSNQVIALPASSGTILLQSDLPHGTYTNAAWAGGATITIPHGLASTPVNPSVTPQEANSATVMAGGYYVTADGTNIYVNLIVPYVGPAIALQIGWQGFDY